jgi:hypothetical protein
MWKSRWPECEDPMRMIRYAERQKVFTFRARKRVLVCCACARLVWDRITSPKARQLVRCWEETADDVAKVQGVNEVGTDVHREAEATGDPALAVALQHIPLRAVEAALAVPGVTPSSLCGVIREVLGNPFHPVAVDPAWLTHGDGAVRKVALTVYAESAFDQLPVLADALEDAGCADGVLLSHLRSPVPHARGCWALDALLGKTDAEPAGA